MNAKLNQDAPGSIMTFAVAALAGAVAIGILSAIASLFQRRGAPLERLAAAERACASNAYQSEREACMKQRLDESRGASVVRR